MPVREHHGRKFDWQPRFDEASRAFPIAAVAPTTLVSKTHRAGALLDQGNQGTCVGHGHEGNAGASPIRRPATHEHAVQWYGSAVKFDDWPENDAPDYDYGTSVLAGAKAGVEMGIYAEYRWAFSLEDVLRALQVAPVVIGVNWYEGMLDPDSNGLIAPTGDVVGGHCVLIRGIAVVREWVRIRNSWGVWGPLGGDARIRFKDLERLIKEDGEFCVATEKPLKLAA